MSREPAGTFEALRVLVIAESLPYPTLKGGDHRTWQNVNALAGFGRVAVFGLCSNDRRRHIVPDLALECWSSSTDPTLAIPPPKGVRMPARAWLLDPTGHPSDLFFSEPAADELRRLMASFRPDVALVEGLWLHGYIKILREAGCRVILDCQNVEAQTIRELALTVEGQDFEARVRRDVLPARTEAIERRAIASADQVWVCSHDDERRIRQLYGPTPPVFVVPNGLRVADYESVLDARRLRPDGGPLTLVYPGFFAYLPNVHAARFLIQEVLPRVAEECEDCALVLVGGQPPPEMLAAAAGNPRITVTGAVRSTEPWLTHATAMPVPLFQGSGTRLKILEAFAAGVPVITTAKGAEGLDVVDGTHALIAENAEQFAVAALSLGRDAGLCRHLTTGARKLLKDRYSWDAVDGRVRQAVSSVAGG